MPLTEDFLKAFRNSYNDSSKVQECYHRKHVNKERIGGSWTPAMEDALSKTATSLGIDNQQKRPSPDYIWFKDGQLMVAIEHENEFDEVKILSQELSSLLNTEASLRVLITYPSATFPGLATADQIERHLKRRLYPEKRPEFIFLVGHGREWARSPPEEGWVYYRWKFELDRTSGQV
jgi:hypothetical protein